MSERTARECLYKFCKRVVKIYTKRYLQKPNSSDIQKLYEFHLQKHGFPGLLGSIDFMHWPWRNCPNAWREQFMQGDQGHPSIILEAAASQDLWIWHAFFGVSGLNNDINVMNQSLVFDDIVKGTDPDTSFTVSGVQYRHESYLADGIYPTYSTIVKTDPHPVDDKRKKFAKYQEAARKDIERVFETLQARWHIIANPARAFTPKKLHYCMYSCILLHNMILEDEGRVICEYDENTVEKNTISVRLEQQELNEFSLRNEHIHYHLQADLIDYIWNNGQEE